MNKAILLGLSIMIISFGCKKKSSTQDDPQATTTGTSTTTTSSNPTVQTSTVSLQIALLDFNNGPYASYTFTNPSYKVTGWVNNMPITLLDSAALTISNPPISSTSIATSPCYSNLAVNTVTFSMQQGKDYVVEIFNGGQHISSFSGNENNITAARYPINYNDTHTLSYECYVCCTKPFNAVVAR